jgi:hypothetical protein
MVLPAFVLLLGLAYQPTFEELLRKVASAPADACDAFPSDFTDVENELFQEAEKSVAQALNFSAAEPRDRATQALEKLEKASAEANNNWPAESRFHFEVLSVPPGIVVKMTYRNRATFSFFARSNANVWVAVDAPDNHRYEPSGGYHHLALFPLMRAPSQKTRFLAKFNDAGCGSGRGVSYYVYEWDSHDPGQLNEIIKLEGSESQYQYFDEPKSPLTDPENSFRPIGMLLTKGPILTLPYCWFSALDSWDNPTLCAVDSYDISGDRPRFVQTRINRPDLLPIAKAIEYAQTHDYPATLAYCGSPDVAALIIRDAPPTVLGVEGFEIKRINVRKERVTLGYQPAAHFEVEKRGDRWLVVSFEMQ